ncbi:MAG TPA: (deoxy)nucleoside triphosphate pyrophosphohydrolase [Vicinamibacterales bacterium]|nr:(deoxy)nucleoside triphosphate pyrophosphohydrolase [Vicinamibacterales bacterium]
MTPIAVVAAVIERDDTFLLTLRPDGTHLAGHWEFPGGKVHHSETHVEALRREIFEELDAVAEVGDLLHTVTHAYPEKTVELFFYRCELMGEPKPMMGQEMRWADRAELAGLPFPDADRGLIAQLIGKSSS